MRSLEPGQETFLAWGGGAVQCRVIAAAGAYVLLKIGLGQVDGRPTGPCSLTYLDGMTPVGWDGEVEAAASDDEVRFRVSGTPSDRRAAMRIPLQTPMDLTHDGETRAGRMLDVSATGLRFRHNGRFETGTTVRVQLQLPSGPLLDADTVVRSSENGACAVEYTRMHAASVQEVGVWIVGLLRQSLTRVS